MRCFSLSPRCIAGHFWAFWKVLNTFMHSALQSRVPYLTHGFINKVEWWSHNPGIYIHCGWCFALECYLIYFTSTCFLSIVMRPCMKMADFYKTQSLKEKTNTHRKMGLRRLCGQYDQALFAPAHLTSWAMTACWRGVLAVFGPLRGLRMWWF